MLLKRNGSEIVRGHLKRPRDKVVINLIDNGHNLIPVSVLKI